MKRSRSIWILPDRLFWYSKSSLTGILNMAALPLHLYTKKQPLADKHSPPDFHLPLHSPLHRPSRAPSLWARLLLNHEHIPSCPYFSPFLLLNTSSSSSFLIYVYFISALPSPPLSYPIFTLLLFLLLASKITALLTLTYTPDKPVPLRVPCFSLPTALRRLLSSGPQETARTKQSGESLHGERLQMLINTHINRERKVKDSQCSIRSQMFKMKCLENVIIVKLH